MDFVLDVKHKSHFDILFEFIVTLAYSNPVLYAEQIYEKLQQSDDLMELVDEMSRKELHKLDIIFFQQGGEFLMNDYNRPTQCSRVWIDGAWYYVTKTALFTFHAEPEDWFGEQYV